MPRNKIKQVRTEKLQRLQKEIVHLQGIEKKLLRVETLFGKFL